MSCPGIEGVVAATAPYIVFFVLLLLLSAGKLDMVIAGTGTGGTVAGIGRFMKEHCPSAQVCNTLLVTHLAPRLPWKPPGIFLELTSASEQYPDTVSCWKISPTTLRMKRLKLFPMQILTCHFNIFLIPGSVYAVCLPVLSVDYWCGSLWLDSCTP